MGRAFTTLHTDLFMPGSIYWQFTGCIAHKIYYQKSRGRIIKRKWFKEETRLLDRIIF